MVFVQKRYTLQVGCTNIQSVDFLKKREEKYRFAPLDLHIAIPRKPLQAEVWKDF